MTRPCAADSRRLARDFLNRPRAAARRIEGKRGRLLGLEEQAGQLERIGGLTDALNTCHDKIRKLRHELKTDAEAYAALLTLVERTLDDALVNEEVRRVIELRYVGQLTWERVAECCFYAPRHVYRIHNRALQILGEHLYRFSTSGRRRLP